MSILTDRKTDTMYEDESAQLWEQQNIVYDGETLRQAAQSMQWAIEDFDKACDCVNEGAELLVDTPYGDQVASILTDMENILVTMKVLRKQIKRGAH